MPNESMLTGESVPWPRPLSLIPPGPNRRCAAALTRLHSLQVPVLKTALPSERRVISPDDERRHSLFAGAGLLRVEFCSLHFACCMLNVALLHVAC